MTISLLFPSITAHPELSSEPLPPPKPPLQPPSLSPRPFAQAAPRYPDTRSGTHRRSGRAGPQEHQDQWGPRREQWSLSPTLCPSPHEAPRAWFGVLLFSQPPSFCFLPHSTHSRLQILGLRFDLATSSGRRVVSAPAVTKRPVIYSAGKCWLLWRDGPSPSWLKAEIY